MIKKYVVLIKNYIKIIINIFFNTNLILKKLSTRTKLFLKFQKH